jgi:hypothetical protein
MAKGDRGDPFESEADAVDALRRGAYCAYITKKVYDNFDTTRYLDMAQACGLAEDPSHWSMPDRTSYIRGVCAVQGSSFDEGAGEFVPCEWRLEIGVMGANRLNQILEMAREWLRHKDDHFEYPFTYTMKHGIPETPHRVIKVCKEDVRKMRDMLIGGANGQEGETR